MQEDEALPLGMCTVDKNPKESSSLRLSRCTESAQEKKTAFKALQDMFTHLTGSEFPYSGKHTCHSLEQGW